MWLVYSVTVLPFTAIYLLLSYNTSYQNRLSATALLRAGVNKSSSVFCAQCSVLGFSVFSFQCLGGPRIRPAPCHAYCLTPPGASIFSSRSLPRASWSLPVAFWALLEPPTISKSFPGASQNLPRASRNRTGRPQNWSPATSSSTIITKSSKDLFES